MTAHVDLAASAIENMSISATSTLIDLAPRPNLPLPRELRNEIYAYLLHHEHARDKPYASRPKHERGKFSEAHGRDHSVANTYRFHTNILAVNRKVSNEAAQVLQSNNFVVVSHKWLDFSKHMHLMGVPTVTEDRTHVAKFKPHLLRLHFSHPSKQLGDQIGSFLMLAGDLPKLCLLMQFFYYGLNPATKLVTHLNGSSAHAAHISDLNTPLRKAPVTKIQFLKKTHMESKLELAKSMLLPFMNSIIALHNVQITNAPDSLAPIVKDVTRIMSPRAVWTKAMAWHMVETLQTFQQTADRLASDGDFRRASVWYKNLWQLEQVCPLFELEDYVYESELETPISALYCLIFHAAVIDGFLHHHVERADPDFVQRLYSTVENLTSKLPTLPEACQIMIRETLGANGVQQAICWLLCIYLFVTRRSEDTSQRALEQMRVMDPAMGYLEHFRHDLRLIENIANSGNMRHAYLIGAPPLSFVGLFELTSTGQLQPQVWESLSLAAFKKPDGLQGFVDTVHLEGYDLPIRSWLRSCFESSPLLSLRYNGH